MYFDYKFYLRNSKCILDFLFFKKFYINTFLNFNEKNLKLIRTKKVIFENGWT